MTHLIYSCTFPCGPSRHEVGANILWDMNNTKWCDGFYIEFRQSFAKGTFSYDEHFKSLN